jgi:putative ABC transport system permease protein
MFLRLVADSFRRRPRHKLLTGAVLALGMAVATASLSVSLDVGDRLASEFRGLGANLLVTSQTDSLPLEIGGVDYRPVNAGAYLPESDLPKIKTVFWHNNIIAFAPILDLTVNSSQLTTGDDSKFDPNHTAVDIAFIGTWAQHSVRLPDGAEFQTGIGKANPWWRVTQGRWFDDNAPECVVGKELGRYAGGRVGGKFVPGLAIGDDIHVGRSRSGSPITLKIVGFLDSGGPEDRAILAPLSVAQRLTDKPSQYRKLYVSALTKPEDDFARRDPAKMKADELERWSCSPYVSSIAYTIKQALPGSDVRVIRRVAEGEGRVLRRVRTLLWLVTFAALLAAGLAVGASSAASVIERRTEIGLMKALGAGSGIVGFLLAAEQLLLAFVGGGIGYALGIFLARLLGERIFGAAPSPSLLVLLVILALAAIVTLLGSAVPLRRAAGYEPAPILRGE